MRVVGQSHAQTRRDSPRWPRGTRRTTRSGAGAGPKGAGGGSSPSREIHSPHTFKVTHPVPVQDLPSRSSLSTWGNTVPQEHAFRVVWGMKKINGTAPCWGGEAGIIRPAKGGLAGIWAGI